MANLKTIGLTREPQHRAFAEATTAVDANPDAPDDPTQGEVIREVCEAYVGFRYDNVDG